MTIGLYMDVHVPDMISRGLRRRGVTVVTAQEDGMRTRSDPALLDRATALGYLFVTQDEDLLVEAARRQRAAASFSGLVFARQQPRLNRRYLADLELIAKASQPGDFRDRVEFLPM